MRSRAIISASTKIAISYVLIGALWILLSDRLVNRLVTDVDALTAIQTYKGWLFVALSGLLIYVSSRRFITRLSQAGSRLAESEHLLSESQRAMLTLQHNLPGMVYRCNNDPQWTMPFVSKGCEDLTGYCAEQLIGNTKVTYGDLIIPEHQAAVWQEVQRAVLTQTPFHLEYRIQGKDGREKWVWEQGCGVFSENRELQALEGYIFDITEKKELEEKLRTSERLQHVGQAASTIIHDLKNQMQVILGHVDLLRTRVKGVQENQHFNIIEARVHTMVSMGRELLDFARGRIVLELSATDLRELLEELVETYGPTFRRQGVQLSLTARQQQSASPVIELDRERLWRVLMNLITNAKEVLASGGQISLRSWIARKEIRIEVQDNGPGIPESIQDTLFEPFVTHGKSGGTGLGLAIVKTIVEAHGGAISVTSASGAGTTFSIRLPRTGAAVAAYAAEAPQARVAH